MDKFTIEGKEVPRIVTYPEVPQPIELIEQRNGERVTVETCSALARGEVNPAGDGEAAELARCLWEQAGNPADISAKWNGWQAAAWIATYDLIVVARLAGPIEFRGKAGSWAGERPTIHANTVEACLRWEIATRYCQCGADRDGGLCLCLDGAFGKLNAALRNGAVIELGQQSLGPINRETARVMLFASRSVQAAFFVPDPVGVPGRPAGTGKNDEAALQHMRTCIEAHRVKSVNGAARLALPYVGAESSNTSTAGIMKRLYGKYMERANDGGWPLPRKPARAARQS